MKYRVFTHRGEREIETIWDRKEGLHSLHLGPLKSTETYPIPSKRDPFPWYTCPCCGRDMYVGVACNKHCRDLRVLHIDHRDDGVYLVVEECPECEEESDGHLYV